MEDQDWKDILELIKTRLEGVDRGDLADEERYAIGDETAGQSRSYLLANAMLKELLHEMYSKSSSLKRRAINNIEKVIENERPITEVKIYLHPDKEESMEYVDVKGKSDAPVSKLRKIISELNYAHSRG